MEKTYQYKPSEETPNNLLFRTYFKEINNFNFYITGVRLLIIAIVLSVVSSCKKFVQIGPPKNSLVAATVFNEAGPANAALLSIYGAMRNESASPYFIPLLTGTVSDELTNYTSQERAQIYQNSINPSNSYTNNIWTFAYNYIYKANAVYEGCAGSNSLDISLKKQLMAEALFIRAYWHFYLVNLYGNVPIVTTTNYKMNAIVDQSTSSQVYNQIISDLEYAKDNLNPYYVDASGVAITNERIRPNRAAAIALLARVFLFVGRYSDAENESSIVIDQSATYNLVGIENVFLRDSQETIWALRASIPTYNNTPEGENFIMIEPPQVGGLTPLSSQLLAAFETGDLRNVNWIGKYVDVNSSPNASYFYPYKYKIKYGSDVKESSIIIRLAELFLIRAEARAQLNKLANAIEDLDKVRQRAGLLLIKDAYPNLNKESLLKAILKERQVELFAEQGHRWLDLKRTKKIDEVMTVVTPLKGGIWNTNKQLWPIPQNELQNNPNLQQNAGYN